MAGGIFPDGQPFALNIKCIIFSLLLAGGYWYLPKRRLWILVALLYFPYLALAWYDYYYKCQSGLLQPTVFPFGEYLYLPYKPPDYKERYNKMPQERKDVMKRYGRFAAFVLLGLVLVYIVARRT